jgi:protein-S-isoprenylcysteine O-methyltransferase Ste14
VIWSVQTPVRYGFYAIQLAGLVGLFVSLWQTGFLQFAGLSQAIGYLLHEDQEEYHERLVTGGTYAVVRHPLYFFSLLVIWFFPTMTLQLLVFNILATLYFIVGSIHEERRLHAAFGEAYKSYSAKVPALIPIRIKLMNRS